MSDEIKYLDFEITVQKAGENEYLVRAESGDGEAEARFVNPFNEDKRALINATLTKVALRSSAKVRSSSAPEVRKMKEFGSTLFDKAISGSVRDFYYKCQGEADKTNTGIRWRLTLDPSVGDLPWEFMSWQDDFVALNPRSPVVRFIKGASRVAPLKEEHPLRLLVVIASPTDEVPLDTSAEKERISAAVESLTEKGLVDVTFIEGPDTWNRLMRALLPNRTHILHFIGHGAFDEKNKEGVLVMEDADSKGMRIDSERLRVLVQGKSNLRLVVLNSCLGTEGDAAQPFSSMAAGLVKSGIPAVIAMQFEISDNAARELAETFYTSLALNMPVDAAVTEARRKIFLSADDSLEWATPILFMQVPDGQLFQFDLETPPTVDIGPPTARGGAEKALATLVISETAEQIPLNSQEIKIGRGTDNDVVLSDKSVSRKHAKLTLAGSTYTIQNLPGSSGTWINGEQVTKGALKDGDVIRLGNVELSFQTAAPAPTKKTRAARDETTAPRAKSAPSQKTSSRKALESDESFGAKAARRYQDGEDAMERGEWGEAAKAFRGALTFVPNYRDAVQKLSVCDSRNKAATFYSQAQRLCADKRYSEALQALAEASRLDPILGDNDNLRGRAECGVKYQRALSELQRGNRDGGAALLREVIDFQSDFEDAEQRLENLAEGGDGLFGLMPAQPPGTVMPYAPPQPSPPAQPASGLQWRLYEVANPDPKSLAEEIRRYFVTQGHETQVFQQNSTWIIQGQKTGWLVWIGMGVAATVTIEATSNAMKVSIGGAKWAEQAAIGAAGGLLTGGITWVTGAVGLAQQKGLIDTLWQISESFVTTRGGRRIR